MWFWMTPYHPVTWHGACALPILPLKWPIDIAFIHYSAMDQGRSRKFCSKYGQMDIYTNSTFQIQKGASRDPISKFWDPLITFERKELPLQIWFRDGRLPAYEPQNDPLSGRRRDHLTQFRHFGTPYNFWTDRSFLHTDHNVNWDELVVVELFSHDAGKTANVIHRNINNNKTANIKGKN